jgi:hypothetical protein
VIDGWLLDLDTVRTWTRNPMIYASAITDGVHNLMTMESSPAVERLQRVIAKLQLCRGCSRRHARTSTSRRAPSSSAPASCSAARRICSRTICRAPSRAWVRRRFRHR